MKCHSCGAEMTTEEYEGINIEVCPVCQGVWLDNGELGQIIKTREEKFDQSQIDQLNLKCDVTKIPVGELKREVVCPKCGLQMSPVNYSYCSGIIIDKCSSNDGVWLDQGEIEKIQIFSEMWEEELKNNKEKYVDLLNKLEQEEEEKNRKRLEAISPSRFGLINSLIRGIVKLDQTVLA